MLLIMIYYTRFRPLIGVIISNHMNTLKQIEAVCFRPLIGVIISNQLYSGSIFVDSELGFRPLIGVIISNL